MGVPKFFRYISERYPCLSEFVQDYQIPVFDNLYLDMNGIIHMCSHPDDGNPHFRITEEKIFADIFHYVEVLFRMIKPQKVFFMAVDGVAPRAKMNQQRGRRFRSAKDAEKLEAEAVRKGEKLPEVERFDSNCITPGTEFMARLHEQLKYFIVNKISTDNLWKKCKVILSGHETPGEGEHKIMDYIRYIRSQPGYDPNTRHCLYGLDADLIMLGLCTHDPHFSLLREEVKFGKKAKRSSVPEEIRFYLLHLSLMREYLELEFAPLKDKLKNSDTVKFDIEKIIDDWILMGFLVGNDFIPNLPNLHIANGALPILYKAYIEVLPTLDGYINEAGTLNLERFEKFMTKLAEIDIKNFEETQEDLYYMKCKTGRKHTAHVPVSTKYGNTENNESRDETDLEANSSRKSCIDPGLEDLIERTNELDVDSDDSESNEDEAAFKCFKDEYYRNKMEYQKVTPEVMREQAEGYVRAIQWNLNYYYNGVCSWSWFYPHHYSPYISDIKGFSDLKIEFELGQPFKPYEQLLAVLPTASKNLLPKCYHHLMTDESSLIKKYYPEEFQTDLNGKRQEWEAVVLVPFIDEEVLLEAMKTCNEQLTPEEVQRNTHGPMLVYEYVSENVGRYKAPEYFPDVQQNHAYCMPVDVTNLRVPKEKLIKGAYPGALFDVYYPGFPTLKHLKYESKLKKAKVKVFEQCSRNENMILRILPNELYFEDSIPEDLLGEIVWVGWPHLVEAKVVAISNRKLKYVLSKDEDKKYEIEEGTANSESLFDSALEGITLHYRDRMGIDFGETKVLVHVKVMVGRKYVFISNQRMNLEKQFATVTSYYPLQSIVTNISVHDEYHTTFREVTDIFPVGSTCFSLTYPYYGSQGIVMESKECLKNEKKLRVSLLIHEEPDFSSVEINNRRQNNDLNLTNSASQLQISNYVFSRITGSLFITIENLDKPVNIGLDLKFNKKNQETPGYTKKIDNNWHYTNQAVNLVKKYIDKFPEVFDYLSKNNSDKIFASDVFPGDNSEEKVREIQIWLKTLPTHNVERRICGSTVLEAEIVAQIEKIVDSLKPSTKKMVLNIKPQLLYKPEIQMGNLTPDPMTKTEIFDRIVNVKEGFTVPVGLKGTVIAIHKPSNGLADETYDVVFDKPFVGGMALNCSENRGYSLSKNSFINLSHGKRFMEQKTGVPGALRALAREKQNSHNFFGISNYSNPTNVNGTQQNSAFASFNKSTVPNSHNKVNHNNYNQLRQQQQQPQLQRQQVQQKPQHFSTSHNVQNKINKNSFYYMADFTQNYGRVTKENAVDQKNTDFYSQNRRHGPSSSHSPQKSLPNNSKARTEVIDTDFLKKILKIADNSKDKSQVENSPGTSQNKESTSSITSASAKLLSYYQSNSLGCPRYTYFEDNVGICAQVALPNGKVICGKGAKSREEASEIVASDALNLLKNDQTLKQKPTTSFPAPPVKWIPQQSKLNSQVFINKSYQTKQSGYSHHQKVNSDEQHKHKTSKANNFNLNNENVEKTKSNLNANTPAFVPLQALKKKQINKPADNSKNENYGENGKSDHSKNATQTTDVKVLNVGSPKETSNKPQRHRKTRIAANFLGNK